MSTRSGGSASSATSVTRDRPWSTATPSGAGGMPALNAMSSVHAMMCGSMSVPSGVHETRISTKTSSALSASTPKERETVFVTRTARAVVRQAIKRVRKPRPRDVRPHVVRADLGLYLGLDERDHAERRHPRPSGRRGHEAAQSGPVASVDLAVDRDRVRRDSVRRGRLREHDVAPACARGQATAVPPGTREAPSSGSCAML